MTKSALEAYDLISFAAHSAARLIEAAPAFETRIDRDREKAWFNEAIELLREECSPAVPLLERARALPELKVVRQESTSDLASLWVDSIEKLLAGITFHLGPRHPIIQALFTHQKFPQLRRAPFEVAEEYASELERRLKSSYVARMLSSDDFAFARPVVEQARAAWAAVIANESDPVIAPADARAIEEELATAAGGIEIALEQARLLAKAALLRTPEMFQETGLDAKPKKRKGASSDLPASAAEEISAPPVVEPEPLPEPEPVEPEPPPAPAPTRKKKKSGQVAAHASND